MGKVREMMDMVGEMMDIVQEVMDIVEEVIDMGGHRHGLLGDVYGRVVGEVMVPSLAM